MHPGKPWKQQGYIVQREFYTENHLICDDSCNRNKVFNKEVTNKTSLAHNLMQDEAWIVIIQFIIKKIV